MIVVTSHQDVFNSSIAQFIFFSSEWVVEAKHAIQPPQPQHPLHWFVINLAPASDPVVLLNEGKVPAFMKPTFDAADPFEAPLNGGLRRRLKFKQPQPDLVRPTLMKFISIYPPLYIYMRLLFPF
jgi:hypothetical protein